MSLKHGILGLLSYSPMSGYDLMKAFNESLNFFWPAQTSQIYRELTSLEKKSLIKHDILIQSKRPNKKIYTLTEEGREEFLHWINQMSDKDICNHKDSFLMKIFFSSKINLDKLEKMFMDYKANAEEQYTNLLATKNIANSYSKKINKQDEYMFWNLTIENGLIYHKGNIEWADYALQLLNKQKKG